MAGTHISNKDLQYQQYTYSDINVIELLIQFRYKYDENLFLNNGDILDVSGVAAINSEVITTYLDLDRLISRCKFSNIQLKLIRLIGFGYTYEEIARLTHLTTGAIENRLNTIYKKIKDENDREWRKTTYTNKLGLKTKICSRCKETLPATDEFFREDSRIKDGFQSRCRKCEK